MFIVTNGLSTTNCKCAWVWSVAQLQPSGGAAGLGAMPGDAG